MRFLAGLAAAGMLCGAAAAKVEHGKPRASENWKPAGEKTGTVATRPGLRLRVVTDGGIVRIHTHDQARVDYRVKVETGAGNNEGRAAAERVSVTARGGADGVTLRATGAGPERNLQVTFDVTVPREYSLDVNTQCGNIETGEVRGRATLFTGAGNVSTGILHGSGRIETAGGHINVKDVDGDLTAITGGGHITAGKVVGLVALRTGGGHIRMASAGRTARIESGGGNISLGKSSGLLVAATEGGEIEVAQATGAIRARTNGGGIHVVNMTGPTDLQTGAGSIYLTRVENAVKASTGAGAIDAWIGAAGQPAKPCELESRNGDIVVHLPRDLAVTIDAMVSAAGDHRIIVDPAFPLKVEYPEAGRQMRVEGDLNGGGERLRLRTTSGDIRLELSDVKRQEKLLQQQMQEMQKQLEQQIEQSSQNQGNP